MAALADGANMSTGARLLVLPRPAFRRDNRGPMKLPTQDEMAQKLGFPSWQAFSADTQEAREATQPRACWYPYCTMPTDCHPRTTIMRHNTCACTCQDCTRDKHRNKRYRHYEQNGWSQ